MKIGVMSDIHAQYDSLQLAFSLFRRHKVDKIICAGDLVEKGDDGDSVVRVMLKIPTVRGNHDESAVLYQRWLQREMDKRYIADTLAKLEKGERVPTRVLTQTALDHLKFLPFQLQFTWEGVKVALLHGSPESNSHYITKNMPDVLIQHWFASVDADVIILGHTHEPMIRKLGKQLILNPGSVYRSIHNRDSHTCAILTLPEKHFAVYALDSGEIILSS
ncbi:MAG: YfcE family phosphodiesterase [Chloroflexota bacterium]